MDLREVRYETQLTRYLFSKASKANIPLSGTFELTPICNLACEMCYVRKTQKEVSVHHRPMVNVDQWINIAKQAKDAGMLYLLLTGGEPFIWPDFWKLYEALNKMGFLISINSNGSLINDEIIEKLKVMPPTRINITLYGACDETYESLCKAKNIFSNVDYAINELKKAGIQVKLNCSLTPRNACDLEKMCEYAKAKDLILEVNTYMFPPLRRDQSMIGINERFTPKEAALYHFKRYRLQYGDETYVKFLKGIANGLVLPPGLDENCIDSVDGKIRCRAGNAAFWITWDGYMTPCGMMTEPKVDVYKHSFNESWHQLSKMSRQLLLSSVCQQCHNSTICHACAAMALAETGSASGIPKYLCEMILEMKNLAKIELQKNYNFV